MSSRCARPVLAAVVVTALAACSRPAAAPATDFSTLRLAESGEYATLNPLETPLGITSKFYDGLVEIGADGELVPGLAASMPEPDGTMTRWTVPLREGITFSDGSAFDADDVVAAYEAVRSEEMASPLRADYAMVESVTAPDPSTVVFRLSYPYAALPTRLTLGIPAAETLGETIVDSSLTREPVGTGPYVLEQWRQGEEMTLAARADHWGGAPQVETVHLSFVPDENARAQRLRTGEFDGAQLSPLLAEQLDGAGDLELVTSPSGDYRAISLPRSLPFFADEEVRRAVNLATNREAMIEGILAGHGEALGTPFAPVHGASYDAGAVFAFDPQEARRLLDAAGWTTQDDGVRAKDGQRFAFDLMYFAEDTLRRDVAQAFASDMAGIGVEVRIESVDRPQAVAGMAGKAFVLGGGDVPYDPDPHAYRMLHSDFAAHDPGDAYSNPGQYADEEVDALLDEARREPAPEVRAELYRELQQRLIEDPPMVTLFALEHTYLARGLEDVSGLAEVVEPHEHGVAWGPWWNVEDWRRSS